MAKIRRLNGRVSRIREVRRRGLDLAWDVSFGTTPDTLITFGDRCRILGGSLLAIEQVELSLGDDVLIGAYCNIRSVDSFVRIGSRVQIAQFVSLIAANHKLDPSGVPLREEHDTELGRHGVIIGDDCWLGAQCVVLPGVELGARCIVGAGAVATHSFPDGTRLAGVPARGIDSSTVF